MNAHIIEDSKDEKIELETDNDVNIPKFDELPILISVDDDGTETYLVQTHDYRFAQFLAIIQNNSNLGLIHSVLDEGLNDEANKETVDHLIQFCQLLHFWADKAISIDEETIKLLKGDKENESDSDSE